MSHIQKAHQSGRDHAHMLRVVGPLLHACANLYCVASPLLLLIADCILELVIRSQQLSQPYQSDFAASVQEG